MKEKVTFFLLGIFFGILILFFINLSTKVKENKEKIILEEQIDINNIIIDTLVNKIKVQNDILKNLKTQKDLIKLKQYNFKNISRDSLIFIIKNTQI